MGSGVDDPTHNNIIFYHAQFKLTSLSCVCQIINFKIHLDSETIHLISLSIIYERILKYNIKKVKTLVD